MLIKPQTAAFLIVLALAAAARADEIVTTTGTSYSGKIVSEDAAAVTIDTPELGKMRIARAEIKTVNRADASDAVKTPPKPAEPAKAPPAADKGKADDKAAKKDDAAAQAADDDAEAAADATVDRATRREASKIVRRTDPAVPAPDPGKTAAPAADEKATIGGAQLAKTAAGTWIVVFQPPKQFESAPAGIQIGRRLYARIDSVGTSSVCLASPGADGERKIMLRLADVQRHLVVKEGASRLRIIEGIDKGAWLRARLVDGTVRQGVLQSAQNDTITILVPKADGSGERVDISEEKVAEIDGLLRSTSTRLALAEAAVGEPLGATLWPDGREIVGILRERTERLVKIETLDGETVALAVDGPIAEVRRLPTKWREAAKALDRKSLIHVQTAEDFADSRMERDVVGGVLALTPYAVTLDTPDGALVLPFDYVTRFGAVESEGEAAYARPLKKSERTCRVPVLPGDPAEKAAKLDPALGVSAVTDGQTVRHVFVTAPFDEETFGIRLGDRASEAQERTDLRFDMIVVPKGATADEVKPAEMVSNTLQGMRVTLLLDSVGAVSAIEISAR